MTTKTPNIVHEAESQRQHVRVELPAKVEIGGEIYKTENWSTGGVSIFLDSKSKQHIFKAHHIYQAKLIFEMDSFELGIPMSLEVRHVNEKNGTIGTRFDNMNERQISIMQHLVGSYITGDLTNVNDLIHVVGRNNVTAPRKLPKRAELTTGEKIKNAFMKMLVPAASLLLFSYVAISVYEQNFIISANSAVVTSNAIALEAPSAGTVSMKDLKPGDKVSKGDVLMSISSASNVISGVDSKCDCVIQEYMIESGDLVTTGQPLAKLVPQDAPLFVRATVSYEDGVRLAKGSKAYIINKAANLQIPATITSINTKGDVTSTIIVEPEQEIPAELLGTPVEVKVDTYGLTN